MHYIQLSNENWCLRRSFWLPPRTGNWSRARVDMVGLFKRLLNFFRINMMEAGGAMIKV